MVGNVLQEGTGGDGLGRLAGWIAMIWMLAFSPSAFGQGAAPSEPGTSEPERTSAARYVDGWVVSMERGDLESVYVCGEFSASERWSFSGCGKGAGFLYRPRPGEMDLAHFRLDHDAPIALPGSARAEFGPGVGLVELQHGRDEPGLKFAPGDGSEAREASGPEVALELEVDAANGIGPIDSVRARWNAGVAWVPDAPSVVQTESEVVPFSTLSLNGQF